MTPHRRRARRSLGVLAVIALVLAVPSLLAARPAPADRPVSAAELLARVRASVTVGYSGYAQSVGTADIPDVRQLGILPSLLGDVTMLRVWWGGADQWRVDKLTGTAEDDTYAYPGGSWEWDSPNRTATEVTAVAPVRLLRPADLTPDQLGRRLAVLGDRPGVSATRDGARRIAGRTALGVRLTGAAGTTVREVQIWVDATSGVPLATSITPVGAGKPLLATTYLTFDPRRPSAGTTTFTPPPYASVQQVDDSSLRGVLGRLQTLPPAAALAGLPMAAGITGATGVAVYGTGLAQIAAVALNRGDAGSLAGALAGTATETDLDGGRLLTISTPLVDLALLDTRGLHVLILGTVPQSTLATALATLEAARARQPFGPPGSPPAGSQVPSGVLGVPA